MGKEMTCRLGLRWELVNQPTYTEFSRIVLTSGLREFLTILCFLGGTRKESKVGDVPDLHGSLPSSILTQSGKLLN